MLRSQAPSVLAKKRENVEGKEKKKGKRPRPNYHESSDENEDPIVSRYSDKLKTAGIDDLNTQILDNEDIRVAHESFIASMLSKPFKMPIRLDVKIVQI